MLFTKKIEPRCAYCRKGTALSEEQVACPRRGVVSAGGQCRHFRYDPLKRTPPLPAALRIDRLREEDLTL